MSIFDGWILFIENRQARQIAENLQKQLSQIKFEVLKSQINPHFMFNSLNVLSGLINVDVGKAQLFIDEFSHIYRYVLETIEQPVVTLNKELEFMRSYLFLQQIRYGNSLTYSVNIPSELLPMLVPPLSLQVLLENAMKHNIVNEEKPLKIEIYSEGDFLFIKNPVQPKISGTSTGLGLKNLIKRYALISKLEPKFKVEDNYYIARIPLIKVEQDERTDH
jgi:two-component system, LytTR family, sensor kinase